MGERARETGRKVLGKTGLRAVVAASLVGWLSGCGGYPRTLNFPFDRQGRSLNSPAAEVTPQVTSRYVAFVSDRNGSQDIYVFDRQQRQLLALPGLNSLQEIASHPAVSEDGRYVVFAANVSGRSGIYLYDRETQQKRRIAAEIQAEVRNPTLSADGSRIAFEAAIDGHWDILVYDRGGGRLNLPGTPR